MGLITTSMVTNIITNTLLAFDYRNCHPMNTTSKKKKRKGDTESTYKRQPWTIADDELLTKGFLHVSKGSVVGNGPKSLDFWKRVLKYYTEGESSGAQRTADNLRSHWHMIKNNVTSFNNIMIQLRAQKGSDWCDDELKTQAHKIYHEEHKSHFIREHVWNLVKDEPKWKTHIEIKEPKRTKTSPLGEYTTSSDVNTCIKLENDIDDVSISSEDNDVDVLPCHMAMEKDNVVDALPLRMSTEKYNVVDALPLHMSTEKCNGVDALPHSMGTEKDNIVHALPLRMGIEKCNGVDVLPHHMGTEKDNGVDVLPHLKGTKKAKTKGTLKGKCVKEVTAALDDMLHKKVDLMEQLNAKMAQVIALKEKKLAMSEMEILYKDTSQLDPETLAFHKERCAMIREKYGKMK
ncbi:hypothetical protein M8C21_022906 [Ambrosia artemisiifolia]|uniref:No apical meristem-associated C-terminal domain-containing protein n=1 Tax=Ambrosia artemisiifolia TaxID=4212 RepID=A0AAD5CJM6_AMBAR|nr:hypothetical protein M8C21_022906 [Ambrosia artemisiifolia]